MQKRKSFTLEMQFTLKMQRQAMRPQNTLFGRIHSNIGYFQIFREHPWETQAKAIKTLISSQEEIRSMLLTFDKMMKMYEEASEN